MFICHFSFWGKGKSGKGKAEEIGASHHTDKLLAVDRVTHWG
jgi:hypothetical protein